MTYAFAIIFIFESLSFVPVRLEQLDDFIIMCMGGICCCGSTVGWDMDIPELPGQEKQCVVFTLVKDGLSFGAAESLARAANFVLEVETRENPATALHKARAALPIEFPANARVIVERL